MAGSINAALCPIWRASQINGCSLCVDMHARELKKEDETDERLFAVAAWRDAPYFTDAERGARLLYFVVIALRDRRTRDGFFNIQSKGETA